MFPLKQLAVAFCGRIASEAASEPPVRQRWGQTAGGSRGASCPGHTVSAHESDLRDM